MLRFVPSKAVFVDLDDLGCFLCSIVLSVLSLDFLPVGIVVIVESIVSTFSTSLFCSFTYLFIRVPNFSTAFVIFFVSRSSSLFSSSFNRGPLTPDDGLFETLLHSSPLSLRSSVLLNLWCIDVSTLLSLPSSPAAFFSESSTSLLHIYSAASVRSFNSSN